MSINKQVHFYSKLLRNQPGSLPGILKRRAREMASPFPSGLATTTFGDVTFRVDTSLHALARKYYNHTHEMYLEPIFEQYVERGSVVIDIGANLGYWSAFAAALTGPGGEVHAFEPVPRFFDSVARLAADNPGYRIFANNAACGADVGTTPMQVVGASSENYANFETNIGSSSALPGFLDHEKQLVSMIDVEVVSLDHYLAAKRIDLDRIGLIKIDVEGYESYCFDGMQSVLSKPGKRVPILCEILTDPKRHKLLDGRRIVQRLQDHGYSCLDATTLAPIDIAHLNFEENIVCV